MTYSGALPPDDHPVRRRLDPFLAGILDATDELLRRRITEHIGDRVAELGLGAAQHVALVSGVQRVVGEAVDTIADRVVGLGRIDGE